MPFIFAPRTAVKAWLHLLDNLLIVSDRLLLGAPKASSSQGCANPVPSASLQSTSAPAPDHLDGPLLTLLQFIDVLLVLGSPKLDAWMKPQERLKGVQSRETSRQLSTILSRHFPTLFCMFWYEIVSNCILRVWYAILSWLSQGPIACTHLICLKCKMKPHDTALPSTA